jgi:uncharacterized protein YqgC (DUF456 family)
MSTGGQLIVALVMLVGLVGVVVPVLPGLVLVWGAGVLWAWLDGGGSLRWGSALVLTLLFVAATVVTYLLPARSAAAAGAPRTTLLLGGVGAVVGFFVLPVVGFPVGGVLAVWLAEVARLGAAGPAWVSTRAVLVAIGLGILVQLAAGLAMVGTWLAAVLVT